MTIEKQNEYLIDLLRVMILELLAYRALAERERSEGTPSRHQEIDRFLFQVRNDGLVVSQLGPDFVVFVREALQGEPPEAGFLLDQFLRQWTPRKDLS